MNGIANDLRQWLDARVPCAIVEIADAHGSTPRERGAFMIVSSAATQGSIGGGQLEFHAIDQARELLCAGSGAIDLDLALGPHLGQCCGGRVVLRIKIADEADAGRLQALESAEYKPHIYIMGAGHTGLALAKTLAPLPFRVTLVDDREGIFAANVAQVSFLRIDDPAQVIVNAPERSGFVILTHSHALDYALADSALRKGSAAYVGMIGSSTKLARFRQWFRARGGSESALSELVCPIGGRAIGNKRPEVIAALTASELIHRFLSARASENEARSREFALGRPSHRDSAA